MKYFKIIFLIVAGLSVSCEDDSTLGVSSVTIYPTIEVLGESVVLIETGSAYTDAGATASAGETEIIPETSISSGAYYDAAFSTDAPDKYVVTYSAENEDGFAGSALREIWVATTGDLTTSIEGLYLCESQDPNYSHYTDLKYAVIYKTGADTYALSHAFGGYYDLGSGYGPNYAARGSIITANDIATNDFTITDATFPGWGDTTAVTEFTVDAPNKTITFTSTSSWGKIVYVTLKQVQL